MFERGKKLFEGMLNLIALAIWVGVLVGAVSLIVGKDWAILGVTGMLAWAILTYRSLERASWERMGWTSPIGGLALDIRRVLGRIRGWWSVVLVVGVVGVVGQQEAITDFLNADTSYGDGTIHLVSDCWQVRAGLDFNKGRRSERYWASSCRKDVLACQKESRDRWGGSGEAYVVCMEDSDRLLGLVGEKEDWEVRDAYEWVPPYIVEPMVFEPEDIE